MKKILRLLLAVFIIWFGATLTFDVPSSTKNFPLSASFQSGSNALAYSDDSADDNCAGWVKQNNGCYWRSCVDSSGTRNIDPQLLRMLRKALAEGPTKEMALGNGMVKVRNENYYNAMRMMIELQKKGGGRYCQEACRGRVNEVRCQ